MIDTAAMLADDKWTWAVSGGVMALAGIVAFATRQAWIPAFLKLLDAPFFCA